MWNGEAGQIMSTADRKTDELYGTLRGTHRGGDARANGYRFHAYFEHEQAHILALTGTSPGTTLDVACGSGLMLAPLARSGERIFGIDFNQDACRDARANGVAVVRGDAFSLPLKDGLLATVVATQFLNQQDSASARRFVHEAARVLSPGGRLIIVWRNGRAAIHRVAHGLYSLVDRLKGDPPFPYINHGMEDVMSWGGEAGLEVEKSEAVLSLAGLCFSNPSGLGAKLLGASYVLILTKSKKHIRMKYRCLA